MSYAYVPVCPVQELFHLTRVEKKKEGESQAAAVWKERCSLLTPSLLTPSLPHCLTPSPPHPLTPHSLTPSLPHSLTPSPPHSSLPHSLTASLPHSLTPSLPHSSPALVWTWRQRPRPPRSLEWKTMLTSVWLPWPEERSQRSVRIWTSVMPYMEITYIY